MTDTTLTEVALPLDAETLSKLARSARFDREADVQDLVAGALDQEKLE